MTALRCRKRWRSSPFSKYFRCALCRRAFNARDDRVARVNDALDQICGCEAFNASPRSPGTVKDGEVLHLLVSDPQHVLDSGEINPVLAMQVDRGGLSVLRGDASDEEFIDTMQALTARGKERYLHGIISFRARRVRFDGPSRFMCVYDTALPGRPHHADVMAPRTNLEKRAMYARQKRVIELVGAGLERPASFRNGLLARYARPAPV